jgi:DNA-binding NarL/FixJ family response regulator
VAAPPRVLLGNLEPMVRVGMAGVLERDGVEVVANEDQPATIVAEAERLRPDVVVLRLDHAETLVLGEQVRAVAPNTKVILWALDEAEMQIFDPGSSTPRLIRSSVSEALRRELTPHQGPTERE